MIYVSFISKGTGDIKIKAVCNSIISSETFVKDLIFYDYATSTSITSKWSEAVSESSYTTINNEKALLVKGSLGNYPSDEYNVIIECDIKGNANYGGLRLYGENKTSTTYPYIYLCQPSGGNDENALIFTHISKSSWMHIKAIFDLDNNSISLYIDDSLIKTVTINSKNKPVFVGGSSANPFYLKNIEIYKL